MRKPLRPRTAIHDGENKGTGDDQGQTIADGDHFGAEGPLVDREGWAIQNADLVNFNIAVWKLE
jgi:hypothetical protein